jgi:hypothetical protein
MAHKKGGMAAHRYRFPRKPDQQANGSDEQSCSVFSKMLLQAKIA